MRGFRRWPLYGMSAVAACTVAMAMTGPGSSALAARSSTAAVAATVAAGSVLPTPASGTPHLVPTGSQDQIIRQLVQCGSTMYAVGRFTQVTSHGSTITRNNIFSFNAASPFDVTAWNPNVNGEVNSIAFNGSDCSNAYIGGQFTSVNGAAANNIAEISTSTGTVVPGFADNATNIVDTLVVTQNGHLLVGGHFGTINGSNTHKYFASLNPATGADDGFLNLKISGQYHYCNSSGKCAEVFPTQIYNQQLSHSGTLDLVEGVFTKVGGQPRQQIFMLNVGGTKATVTGWTSPEFDGSQGNLPSGYPYQCWWTESFYVRAAAWSAATSTSPADSTVYLAATGKEPWNQPKSLKRIGLCDATTAFPATQTSVTHTWIDYTGCDSLYSVAADASTVYAAGHPRWAENANDCNAQGPNAVPDVGLQGLTPATGQPLLNGSGTAGLYSMSRANADDMLVTSAGLWIGSTDRGHDDHCGGVGFHGGICFLPYSS
jgi:hypothetical protein